MIRASIAFALTLLVVGCDRGASGLRRYREIATAPERVAAPPSVAPAASGADMASTPVTTAQGSLSWAVPSGWTEEAGGAMRLATFRMGEAPARGECAITAFPGEVGGIESNLRRWLGQMQVTVGDAELARFARSPLTFQSDAGLPCLVYDFAAILPAGQADSLLATIVPLADRTIFLKFTGPSTLLAAEKERFLSLCRSLKP